MTKTMINKYSKFHLIFVLNKFFAEKYKKIKSDIISSMYNTLTTSKRNQGNNQAQ
jgi:hypothetical protein